MDIIEIIDDVLDRRFLKSLEHSLIGVSNFEKNKVGFLDGINPYDDRATCTLGHQSKLYFVPFNIVMANS